MQNALRKGSAAGSDPVAREPLVTSRALLMALLRAREAVMVHLRPILNKHDLSEQQARVIRTLYRGKGLRISDVSARTFISMSSLTRIVRTLEDRKLLVRSVCEQDQRAGVLALTGKGRTLFSNIVPLWDQLYDSIESKYGHQRLQTLYTLLEELEQCMDTLGEADEKPGPP